MTTTTELHFLARSPQAFDTALAELHTQLGKAQAELARRISDVYRAAGARRVSTRHGVRWDADYATAHNKVRETRPALLEAVSTARFAITAIELEIQAMDAAYTGWTRFFPSVTKSQPHIHRSLTCRTLHATTVMTWAPQLSGKTDEQAVAELDEALCSVCFPGAPVALHNYVSRKSQAERDERQAAKDARDAAKAAKQLVRSTEVFRTGGKYGEQITTVAACKELIRKAVELAVELDWYSVPANVQKFNDPANVVRNAADRLEELRQDAAEARRVLIAREARHEGYGMTEQAIDDMMARKDRAARKEWGL